MNAALASCPLRNYSMPSGLAWIALGNIERGIMAENLEFLNIAVSLLSRAALLAARLSGRVRQRSLKRLSAVDADAKAKEILYLKDRVYQPEMQLAILQKQLTRKGTKPRYEVRERLLILWPIEADPSRSRGRLTGASGSVVCPSSRALTTSRPCAPNSSTGTTCGGRI
jgi:hypothetical protein